MAERALLKTFPLELDLRHTKPIRPFEVVEGDMGNVLVITLTDSGEAVDIEDATLKLVFSSSKGVAVQEADSMTVDGNELTVELYPASYSAGLVECELQIYTEPEDEGDARLRVLVTTAKFSFVCRRAILNGDSITTVPQFPLLTQLMEDVSGAEAQRQSNEQARIAHEALRQAYELMRQANEQERQDAEDQRQAAETSRSVAETARAAAEAARAAAETARAAAETAREDAEAVRAAAEAEREDAFEQMLDEGAGVTVVTDPPTALTEGSVGDLLLALRNGKTYICTAAGSQQSLSQQTWRRFGYESDWTTIKDVTLSASASYVEADEDANGNSFLYDELRVTVIGYMTGATSVNVSVNGSLNRYIRDNTFLSKDCYDVTENMTVMYLNKAENGFIRSYRETGGVMTSGSYSGAKSPQAGFLKVSAFTGFSAVRVAAATTTGAFVSGTRFIIEGRNIN